jgi:acyl-CoA reductase-like NAD-dependent aldehyde dehydrogenase
MTNEEDVVQSYVSYVNGRDLPEDADQRWLYCLRASAFLRDVLPALSLKRDLESGRRTAEDAGPDVVARVALSSPRTLQAALEAAAAAAPAWAAMPLETRMEVGRRFHEEVRRRRHEFVEVLVAEGHPRALAEWEVAGVLRGSSPELFAYCRSQLVQEMVSTGRTVRLERKPDGVVALSPPQNAAASNSLLGVPALVAGNALVVKAPRSTPYGVLYAWRNIVAPILEEVGAPPGTLNIVCGHPKKVLASWLESPLVDDIFFFGSSENGVELERDAVAAGKKTVLELAGNDGFVVWRDADLDAAAEAATECFFGSGQICMVPKYVLVHPDVADAFLDRLIARAAEIRPGYPDEDGVLLSPVLKTDAYFAMLKQAADEGCKVVVGGRRLEVDGTPSTTGLFVEPTVLRVDGLEGARRIDAVRRETFFPLLPVVVPDARDAAVRAGTSDALLAAMVAFLNANEYGLRNSVWARDPEVVDVFAAQVRNGGLLKINDSHIGFVPGLATHGGNGLTGGVAGELNYPMLRTTHLQGISIGHGVRPRRAVFSGFDEAFDEVPDPAPDDPALSVVGSGDGLPAGASLADAALPDAALPDAALPDAALADAVLAPQTAMRP